MDLYQKLGGEAMLFYMSFKYYLILQVRHKQVPHSGQKNSNLSMQFSQISKPQWGHLCTSVKSNILHT